MAWIVDTTFVPLSISEKDSGGKVAAKGGRHGKSKLLKMSFPCKTGPDFAHNLMSVKYWTNVAGARVNFEKGNCYITKADGKKPAGEHIPFEDIKGGYALRIANKKA